MEWKKNYQELRIYIKNLPMEILWILKNNQIYLSALALIHLNDNKFDKVFSILKSINFDKCYHLKLQELWNLALYQQASMRKKRFIFKLILI